jgi:hypothetical protein
MMTACVHLLHDAAEIMNEGMYIIISQLRRVGWNAKKVTGGAERSACQGDVTPTDGPTANFFLFGRMATSTIIYLPLKKIKEERRIKFLENARASSANPPQRYLSTTGN